MASIRVNPTRMELNRLKRKRLTATKGHRLLKDKRDELMRQFLQLVQETMELRKKVEDAIKQANVGFLVAKASMSLESLNVAFMGSGDDAKRYGYAFTSFDLDEAVERLTAIYPDMVNLARLEHRCEKLSAEIEKTRRRVNALEYVVIPDTEEQMRYISMKLDENERGTQTRLMKIKEQMY
ncbi:MAG: V-type ATP synthase subunit D [Lachnospira sp.]|nr:V-type ATP synthase subunit D [Lachnospira sp.]